MISGGHDMSISDMNENIRKSISEQLESICKFPALVHKYPHPHLAQISLFLIADIFVKGIPLDKIFVS